MDLPSLITRLEVATGPDRELDLAIWNVLNPKYPFGCISPALNKYTSSIDAALTLVPEGFAVDLTAFTGCKYGDAFLWSDSRESGLRYSTRALPRRPANPAIALCIAALKARAVT